MFSMANATADGSGVTLEVLGFFSERQEANSSCKMNNAQSPEILGRVVNVVECNWCAVCEL